jgi:hypothetical protein
LIAKVEQCHLSEDLPPDQNSGGFRRQIPMGNAEEVGELDGPVNATLRHKQNLRMTFAKL